MDLSTSLSRSALAAILALSSACQSLNPDEPTLEQLPYHVALIPPSPDTFEDETPTSAIADDEDGSARIEVKEFAFSSDDEKAVDVNEVLRAALEGDLFTRVTHLEPPPGGGAVPAGWWASRAKLAGADLLLEIDQVTYDSRPSTKGRPWNYFWFLTGPLVYAFHDRDYRLEGTIQASLYDLQGLPEVEGSGTEDLSAYELGLDELVRRFRAKPDWVSTKFGDRVDGKSEYATSLILPTSQLASDSLNVRKKVATMSLESMAEALAREISIDSEFVAEPDLDQNFHLGETAGVALAEDGAAIVLDTTIWQTEFSADTEFREAAVRIGSDVVIPLDPAQVLVNQVSDRGGWVKRRLQVTVPVELAVPLAVSASPATPPPVARTLQLVLTDGHGDGETRSWTFGLSDQDHARAVEVIGARLEAGEDIGLVGDAFRVEMGDS